MTRGVTSRYTPLHPVAADIDPTRGVFGKIESKSLGGQDLYLNAQQGITGKSGDVVGLTRNMAEGRYGNLYKAFRFADLDNSGAAVL